MNAAEVSARFDDAVRRGDPGWLWPEVPAGRWREALAQIEHIARDVLRDGRSTRTLAGDPLTASVAAYTSGMGPLLGHWQAEGRFGTAEPIATMLAHHLAHNTARMESMAREAQAAVGILAARGIEPAILKGMDTAFAHFPAPGTRPLSDIDLLIAPADEPAAADALRSAGYHHCTKPPYPERTWRKPGAPATPASLLFVHEADGWSIDLHLTLDRRHTSAAPRIRLDDAGGAPWQSSPLHPAARTLGQPAKLLTLAVHAGGQLINLTLLRLTELVLVIRQDSAAGGLAWPELLEAGAHAGALGAIYPALHFCEQLAPGTVPEPVLRACREAAPERVLRFIAPLSPATAHGHARCSLEERLMWMPSRSVVVKQLLYDFLPIRRSWREIAALWRMMAWRLIRRTVTR